MDKIKFVYFDIGNVMCDCDDYFKGVTEKFGLDRKDFTDFWLGVDSADAMTRGKLSPAEFWQNAIRRFSISGGEDFDFLECWMGDYKPILPVHELAKKISGEFGIGLLSNLYPGMMPRLAELGLVARLKYGATVYSCETGYRKPEKEIFKIATDKSGIEPDKILFIDDREDFLEGAGRMRWRTYRFDINKINESVKGIADILGI